MGKKGEVKVRKTFNFLPGLAWAIILDAISIALILLGIGIVIVASILGAIGGPIFAFADQIFTMLFGFIQIFATYLIFEDPRMLLIGGGKTIPILGSILNAIPSFTILYILLRTGYMG